MEYRDAIDWLYGVQRFGVKLGLENTQRLLRNLDLPDKGQRFIHVAGTNGKGSVCAMIDSVLREAGVRVGLFTSPHLVTFPERIRVDGEMIPEEELRLRIAELRRDLVAWDHDPTFFELTFAIALWWFRDSRADVAVLETGMGGRLDATNVIEPSVSVITPIAMDHEAILGDSLTKIAYEKAGIIKPGVPVVSARQRPEAASVISEVCRAKKSELTVVERPSSLALSLAGEHQAENAALAEAVLKVSGIEVSDSALRTGFAKVRWPARFQLIDDGRIVIDGAHNPSSAGALGSTWKGVFGDEKAVIVLGMVAQKDVEGVLVHLLPLAAEFVLTSFDNPRAISPDDLAELLPKEFPVTVCGSVPDALARAAAAGGRVLVAGSLFLAGEAIAYLEAEADHEPSAQ